MRLKLTGVRTKDGLDYMVGEEICIKYENGSYDEGTLTKVFPAMKQIELDNSKIIDVKTIAEIF